MPNFKKFLALFSIHFFLFTILDILAGKPPLVDEAISFSLWLAILAQFLLWLASIQSWGRILSNSAGIENCPVGVNLALGSLFYAFIALLLAWVGLLSPPMKYFLFILQSLALALVPLKKIHIEKVTLLACVPLFLLFALYALDSLVIHPYWDPLHHHLVGARLFWERGQMYFPRNAVASYQEGGFELLFLWPHFLFAKAGGLGLLPVQIFAQLTHSVLGFGGSILVAYALAKRWLPNLSWQLLALTLFAVPASLIFAVPMAKNEWGIVLWILSGFWLLSSMPLSTDPHCRMRELRSQLALAGLLWGFAFLAKLSSGFAIAGLSTIVLYRRLTTKEMAFLSCGFLLGALPLALRNFGATGNPLFPLLPDLFHTKDFALGPTWREAMAAYQMNPMGFSRIKELFEEFPLAPGLLLSPLLALKRNEEKSLRSASAALTIGLLLFSFLAGKATELRLLGPLLPISALLLVVLLQKISQKIPANTKHLPWILLALLALALPYRWEALLRLRSLPYAHLLSRSYVSGEAQGWVRDHYQPGMKVALLVETRTYHSLPLPIIRPWDSPLIDSRLRNTKTAPAFIQELHALGFTHLILSQEKLDLFYPKELVGQIEAYVLPLTDTHSFRSEYSIVADVTLLMAKTK